MARDSRRGGRSLWKSPLAICAGAAAVLFVCLPGVSAGGAVAAGVTDASFVPGPSFDAGHAPAGMAVADFNGDHVSDLAVANCLDEIDATGKEEIGSEVTILLGDGSGGAGPGVPPPLPAGAFTCSLASADLNGDGASDLAVVDSTAKDIVILLGDGTGRFAPASGSPVHVDGTPTSVVAADVNGDRRPDFVVPVADSHGRITGIEVLRGDGAGGFAEAPGSPVPIVAGADVSVAVADLDGDGKPDLAVANTQQNDILVLHGDGTGGFGPPTTVRSARRPQDIAVGDFDGNGKPDLAALVTNGVAILLGDGSGNFHAPAGSPLPGYGNDLAVADLNGDGTFDLVTSSGVTSSGFAASVSVEVATGGGAFRRAAFSPFAADDAVLVAVADFNGDGRPDIATLSAVLLQTESAPQAHPGRALRGRDAVFGTRKPITALAANGKHFAVCAGSVPTAWSAPGHASVTFKTGTYGGCDQDLAVSADRVAWTQSVGCGNTECVVGVFVSKLSGGRPQEVDEEQNFCGGGPCLPTGVWISDLLGGGPLIAWSDQTVECTANCDEGEHFFAQYAVTAQTLVRFYGGHARGVRQDRAARPLLAVGGGRMALQVGGRIVVLKPSGARVSAVSAPDVQSVALSGTELGIAGRSALRLCDPATGRLRKTIALGPNAALQLAGITSRFALLRGPHALVLLRLSDGALVSFPLASKVAARLVDAKLTAAGLFYAYNVARGKSKGRIVFEPTSRLLARF
jgi:hypothetical protein